MYGGMEAPPQAAPQEAAMQEAMQEGDVLSEQFSAAELQSLPDEDGMNAGPPIVDLTDDQPAAGAWPPNVDLTDDPATGELSDFPH